MMGLRVRVPAEGDGPAMARVHVRAWQAAYQGLMPATFLDGLDEVEGGRAWDDRLGGQQPTDVIDLDHEILVLEDAGAGGSELVGIATVGPDRSQPESDTGELWMLNVHPDAWGTGAGAELLDAASQRLGALGYRRAVLWVVAGNRRARRFYERHGWLPDDIRKQELLGGQIPELRYSLAVLPAPAGPTGRRAAG